MGPKAFITCYVCFREFGSRSIPFHEPQCIERWRSFNRHLPPEKRSTTPVKPVGWKHSAESTWICTNCKGSVPEVKRDEHTIHCLAVKKLKDHSSDNKSNMAPDKGSPRKGKENKNNNVNKSNSKSHSANVKHIISSKNDSNSKTNFSSRAVVKTTNDKPPEEKSDLNNNEEKKEDDALKEVSTSNRSIRPQTKILRRPTPNLRHPVIQIESDDATNEKEKSKEENPKRLKTNEGSGNETKPRNFIMYNKYNVEKNIKNSPKERTPAVKDVGTGSTVATVPNPCYSCSRSVAPERLHSHARRDARGLMLKKLPSADAKQSPRKKLQDAEEKKGGESKNDNDPSQKKQHDKNDKVDVPKVSVVAPVRRSESQRVVHVCYICGREFGATSLPLHENNCLEPTFTTGCLEMRGLSWWLPNCCCCSLDLAGAGVIVPKPRWKRENETMSPSCRRSAPKKPEPKVRLDTSDPSWQEVQAQLVPCPSCGRTFFPERLPIHQRVCKGKSHPSFLGRASSFKEQSTSQEQESEKTIIYVPCYICGKCFGSWVVQMHESQCLRRWRRENEKLPEHLQQPEPHKPQRRPDRSRTHRRYRLGESPSTIGALSPMWTHLLSRQARNTREKLQGAQQEPSDPQGSVKGFLPSPFTWIRPAKKLYVEVQAREFRLPPWT